MPFFKDLRRRSKASVRTVDSSNDSSNGSNGTVPTAKSSSTLNSSYGGSTTPPFLKTNLSYSNLATAKTNGSSAPPPVPQRPAPLPTTSNRNSMIGLTTSPTNGSQRSTLPLSQFAPKVISINDNTWVNQKVFLIYGEIGDPTQRSLDGNLTIHHHQDSFPPMNWPVYDSRFKALVHLSPGANRIRLDFTSPKLSPTNASPIPHSSYITINFLPLVNSPPLQLVILLGSDSPGTYDAVPERVQREGNGLDTAIRKFRVAAYLWQAFTSEQMYRNGFSRRCFRYEEEWQTGTLSLRDRDAGVMRNEAKIHIVRTDKTVAELRDLQRAQQYSGATKSGELYDIAAQAVRNYFGPGPGQKQYVSVLLLDSHWDKNSQTITGHAALGGTGGDIQLAIFGSHALQSYPSALEEVWPAFMDCTRTDTTYVANDCNESGSNWEAANIGIGAHLHETGHLFGCPHQESGVMLRDYVRFNRTFMMEEPYSTRTKSQGTRLSLIQDECNWHRLDTLRFRFHPCFRTALDPPLHPDESVQVWPVDNGKILVTAATGVAFIELYSEGDDVCKTFVEFLHPEVTNGYLPKITELSESEMRQLLPDEKRKKKLKLEIFSAGLGKHTVEDLSQLRSKSSSVKLPNGSMGYKSSKLGFSQMEGSQPEQVILESPFDKTKLLTSIKVYHGAALDGIEFRYEDSTSQLFGKRGGTPGGSEFFFDTRRGEILMGFHVRAGLWIDGVQILTSMGRRSPFYGNPTGGSAHTLMAPREYRVAGVSGSCAQFVDGFSLIITR